MIDMERKSEIRTTLFSLEKQSSLHSENEASTRLKIIDRILKEILDWSDEDIHPEEHVTEDGATTFADYILKTANTAIIVEAKKYGADFSTDAGQRRVKLTNKFLESELGAAIIQARDYARKMAIDFAIATNGSVWAVFPAQRHDQVRFHESTALVFWSLNDALNENYQEFYDLLSRESVISGSLETALLGRTGNQIDTRKLNRFFTTNIRRSSSNPLYPIIENEVVSAFSDSIIELDEDSFERCYVANPESIKFDKKIRMNIARREPIVGGAIKRVMKETDNKSFIDRIKGAQKFSGLGRKASPLAILLLGTVGAGKTTFLHYMRKVRMKELFEDKETIETHHWLHLDFLNNPSGTSASEFIYRSLLTYIQKNKFLVDGKKCVQHAYADEITALRSTVSFLNPDQNPDNAITAKIMDDIKQVKPFVETIIKHVTANASFFLVIDNVDQIESEQIQSNLFTEAFSIARSLSLNLVLCLRQSTFAKHKNSPAIDAFDFEAVQIDPPIISSVLAKRFALIKYMTQGHRGEFVAENGAIVKVENISEVIDLLQGSILGTEIGTRIEVLATEDVRLALRMTREFLERGYTSPGKAIEFHKRTGKYVLPKHEAFRAIMLGTSTSYNEEQSPIGNPFDARQAVNSAQMLRLYILSACVAYASENTFRYVDGEAISECMKKIGFGDSYVRPALEDLCKLRFLFTASHGQPTELSNYVPSRLGGYIIRDLISNFTYIENVMFDTYISDLPTWQKLKNLSHNIDSERDIIRRVILRTQRARVFYDYMHSLLKVLVIESQKRGLPAQWCHDVMKERRLDFIRELRRVKNSAERNYSKEDKEVEDIDD
ncbi:TPA: hypothetical protein ACL1SD_006262 [Pseudomonas aeruginosa]|uniref:hypothetical protein n=1 Tax=Pseudomonas aeruginosa TaxID=287 RepID=UPI0018C6F628|nr:hypothetical protein [Pseudomonas aeruginosa]EIU1684308.1 hypothetical protein [Pseudomonas aeruginosa]